MCAYFTGPVGSQDVNSNSEHGLCDLTIYHVIFYLFINSFNES